MALGHEVVALLLGLLTVAPAHRGARGPGQRRSIGWHGDHVASSTNNGQLPGRWADVPGCSAPGPVTASGRGVSERPLGQRLPWRREKEPA